MGCSASVRTERTNAASLCCGSIRPAVRSSIRRRRRSAPQAPDSFRLDDRRLDDGRPARDLAFHERSKRLLTAPGFVWNFGAEFEHSSAYGFVIERLVERGSELVENRPRCPLG